MLQTEAFQAEVDAMSAWHPTTEYSRIRRKTVPLAQQCLTSPALAGFETAVHRGMLHLVLDYQEELLLWEKATQRHKVVKLGDELPETGEAVSYTHLTLPTKRIV